MISLNKKWKIYVIHHSHTDIGYTERQEKIEAYHVDYIKQAVDILNRAYHGDKKEWQGFKWVCEGFWGVERFLENSDKKHIQDFENYVKEGKINISGSYLNMTELINGEVQASMIKRGIDYGYKLGTKIDSAMTADINGYSWGYADALYDNGIENLISFIHPHHGMFPLWKKQTPFWWESPKGNKILVWNSEYYHFGNELGLVEGQETTYMIHDKYTNGIEIESKRWERAQNRILGYLSQLEREDYPYNFVPIAVSGIITDNAPPNGKIMDFINKWNLEFGYKVEIEMTTLSDYFNILRSQSENIPIYKGDWTDWWADGVGSTPAATKHFREAQRKYSICRRLDKENILGSKNLLDKAKYNLMLYAEHTWGYSASISEPWSGMVNDLDLRKTGFAINANENISRNLDKILFNKGEIPLIADMKMRFKIINPFDIEVKTIAKLYLNYWESTANLEVVEEISGTILPHQSDLVARGLEFNVLITLGPREERILILKKQSKITEELKQLVINTPDIGAEGIKDLICSDSDSLLKANYHYLETPFFKISYTEEQGITSIIDKVNDIEILRRDKKYNAFTPIYEVTPVTTNMNNERRIMGRNRKSISTKRYEGVLTGVKIINQGELFISVELKYEIKGTSYFTMILTSYKDVPKIDVAVRINKDNIWEPENLYISLPFTLSDKNEELWIEKSGCILRPGVDQLPGSCMDFYSIQEGLAYVSKVRGLAIAIEDAPLISLGTLKSHEIQLFDSKNLEHNSEELYSWVMNNFWETNFKASLGGFYEFNYHIYLSDNINTPERAIDMCSILNQGVIAVRIN